jgi:hypothetical protein
MSNMNLFAALCFTGGPEIPAPLHDEGATSAQHFQLSGQRLISLGVNANTFDGLKHPVLALSSAEEGFEQSKPPCRIRFSL